MNPRDPAPISPLNAAHVRLEQVRRRLLVAVDELRTPLINSDDLKAPADTAVGEPLAGITELAEAYRAARGQADAQPRDLTAGPPRRRYINPGDTILLVLPDTTTLPPPAPGQAAHLRPRYRRRNPPRPGHRPAPHPALGRGQC